MTKYLRDGVFKYGDNPLDVLGKYVKDKPVNNVTVTENHVALRYDEKWLCSIFNPENYNKGSLQPYEIQIDYYRVDTRVFLSKELITPDLIGKTIKTGVGSAITVYAYEVGTDYVTFKHRDNRNDPYLSTAPFEGLSSWWIVESTS